MRKERHLAQTFLLYLKKAGLTNQSVELKLNCEPSLISASKIRQRAKCTRRARFGGPAERTESWL